MQKIPDGQLFQCILTPELYERLNRAANRLGIKRAQCARNMLDAGLTVFEDFERIGIISLAEILRKTKKALGKEIGQQSLFTTK